MKTKHLFLTAFAVAALITASFSNIFSSDKEVALKCYDDKAYFCPDDSTGDDEDGNGTPIYPPIGN
jgi:hypothetical protein